MKLDIFNHIFPTRFYERMLEVAPNGRDMHKRVRAIPSIVDLDARFRIMDMFGDYAQVICLGAPPIEVFGPPPVSTDLARLANDGMAELVARHPDRFPAFIASLPMNDPDGLLKETERAPPTSTTPSCCVRSRSVRSITSGSSTPTRRSSARGRRPSAGCASSVPGACSSHRTRPSIPRRARCTRARRSRSSTGSIFLRKSARQFTRATRVGCSSSTGAGQPKQEAMPMDERERHDKGMTVRRAVLGDAHVDRAIARKNPLT